MSLRATPICHEPVYYHRDYQNDLPKKEEVKKGFCQQALRVTQVALPFISLYKPLGQPLSIVLGGTRVISSVAQMITAIHAQDSTAIGRSALEVAIAVTALACSILAHPLGMLVTTSYDMIINVIQLTKAIQDKDYKKAAEIGLHLVSNAVYLSCFLVGSLELSIASIGIQIFIGLYSSCDEFKKGNYLEGCAHLLMSGIRGNQMYGQVQILEYKNAFEKMVTRIQKEALSKKVMVATAPLVIENASASSQQSNPVAVSSPQKKLSVALAAVTVSTTNDKTIPDAMREEVINILVRYGGDPESVIFSAANAGDQSSVIKLLDYGFAHIKTINNPAGGAQKWNITDSACRGNNIELMNYLIEDRKILPNCDHFSYHVKHPEPNLKVIDFLLSKGYKFPSTIIFDAFYESQYADYEFYNAKEMHYKCDLIKTPKIEFIKFLIDRGAKIQDIGNIYKLTFNAGMEYIWHALLHNMYVSDNPKTSAANEMIQLLLSHGLNPNINSRWMPYTPHITKHEQAQPYNHYHSPLGVAIQFKDLDLAKYLLAAGANPNANTHSSYWSRVNRSPGRWEYGKTISLIEIAKGNKDMSKLLLEYWIK